MDPNETLKRMRELASLIMSGEVGEWHRLDANGFAPTRELTKPELLEMGSELAELTESLDEWLSKKGFLPEAWNR